MDKSISSSEKRTVIQVAVGIVSNRDGKLLVAKRPDHWLGGGFWEFPGGKIEPNEDSESALKRELQEEVGIIVEECSPLIKLTYDYPERTVVLHAWVVNSFKGEAAGLEGQEIGWRDPNSLNNLNMLPANRAIVVATQLPDFFYIASAFEPISSFLQNIEQQIKTENIKMLQVNTQKLPVEAAKSVVHKLSDICKQYEAILLLDQDEVSRVGLDKANVHLSSDSLHLLKQRPLPRESWVCVACHNYEDIIRAEKLSVDFLLVPVHGTTEDAWEEFGKLVALANLPVYAMGDLIKEDIVLAKKHGAHGVVLTVARS